MRTLYRAAVAVCWSRVPLSSGSHEAHERANETHERYAAKLLAADAAAGAATGKGGSTRINGVYEAVEALAVSLSADRLEDVIADDDDELLSIEAVGRLCRRAACRYRVAGGRKPLGESGRHRIHSTVARASQPRPNRCAQRPGWCLQLGHGGRRGFGRVQL